jgi:hypothetical protein
VLSDPVIVSKILGIGWDAYCNKYITTAQLEELSVVEKKRKESKHSDTFLKTFI